MIDVPLFATAQKMERYLIGKSSGGDFKVTYNSISSISCINLPPFHNSLVDGDVLSIVQISPGGKSTVYFCDSSYISIHVNEITVLDAKFVSTDTFLVYTNIERFPVCDRIIPATSFGSENIGMSDGVWINYKTLQDMRGIFYIGIWWDLIVNNSTGNELRVLCSATDGGTLHKMYNENEYIVALGDVDDQKVRPFSVGDLYPYIQIQTRALNLGLIKGTISINLTQGWTLD